jgi:uncharacterized protein (DUF488 family)
MAVVWRATCNAQRQERALRINPLAVSPHGQSVGLDRTSGDMRRLSVFTIGHSTRSIEDFVHLLKSHEVERVLDVRSMPRSQFNPQYDITRLPTHLEDAGIHYTHMPGLGGLRRAQRDSVNRGWRNASFRGYADYMQTPAFSESLDRCLEFAAVERVVLMCAEAVPWRCHRSLIADALWARGVDALEIASDVRVRPHALTPFARVHGTSVTYPLAPPEHDATP